MEIYAPVKGKCTWWRERPDEEDAWDVRVPRPEKRVHCSCFVEGHGWEYRRDNVPSNCPEYRRCRYYIKHT